MIPDKSLCDWVEVLERAGHWPEPATPDEVVSFTKLMSRAERRGVRRAVA